MLKYNFIVIFYIKYYDFHNFKVVFIEIYVIYLCYELFMVDSKEIAHFLKEFKQKMKIWDVLFRDERGKNTQSLAEFEIKPSDRKKVLEELNVEDYCQESHEETQHKGIDIWVFGKVIKRKLVCIKISMGFKDASVLCTSFRLAEHELYFPLK